QMSIHPSTSQFEQAITPLPPSEQKVMELSLRLSLSLCLPPKIRNARTANWYDLELRRQRFEMVSGAFREYAAALLSEINENLPVTEVIDTKDFFGGFHDICSNISAAFERRMGE